MWNLFTWCRNEVKFPKPATSLNLNGPKYKKRMFFEYVEIYALYDHMMNESFPYSIATILILQVWRKQSFSFEKKYQSAWGGFWGHFLQWWSVFLVSKSGLWVSIGPKSLGPWNRFWDFESIWSSQKAHKFRRIKKTCVFCILTP